MSRTANPFMAPLTHERNEAIRALEPGWASRVTPRRHAAPVTDVSPPKELPHDDDDEYAAMKRPLPVRRELYRIPHDHIVTDVFVEWQEGAPGPALLAGDAEPLASSSGRSGHEGSKGSAAAARNAILSHIGEGSPVPPPACDRARRTPSAPAGSWHSCRIG